MFDTDEYKTYKTLVEKATVVNYPGPGVLEISNKNKKQMVTYKPPVYKNVHESLRLYNEDYHSKSIKYIKTGKQSTIVEMNSILDKMDALVYYYVIINSKDKLDKEGLVGKIAELQLSINNIDTDYKAIIELQNELFAKVEKIKVLENIPAIDFYIQDLPEKVSDEAMAPAKKKKTNIQINLAPVIQNTQGQFPFNKLPVKIKTLEECNSRSNKKPYYISLKDLLNAIENDEELKGIFGPKYKKMSKKDLCDVMMK
jgi:hypothetical protein